MKLWWAIPLMLVACGKDSPGTVDARGNGSGSGSGGNGACTLTLSGALTGTYACTANAAYATANNQGGLAFPVTGFSGMLVISFGFPGEPHTGTFHSTDTGAKGGASIVTGSGTSTMVWAAATGSGAPVGSYDITLSSVSVLNATTDGKNYAVDGTFDATLAPKTGQSGTVMITGTY